MAEECENPSEMPRGSGPPIICTILYVLISFVLTGIASQGT
jgi:hypothetical protein